MTQSNTASTSCRWRWLVIVCGLFSLMGQAGAQQVPEGFSWLNWKAILSAERPASSQHFAPSSPESVAEAALRSIEQVTGGKYTAIREVGVLNGTALVITATRPADAQLPERDKTTVYAWSPAAGTATLLEGYDMKLVDWERFIPYGPLELVLTYTDCVECQQTKFFSTLYLDPKEKQWKARWSRLNGSAVLSTAGNYSAYALLDNGSGVFTLASWTRPVSAVPMVADHGSHSAPKEINPEDHVFEYKADALGGSGLTQPVSGTAARDLKVRICTAEEPIVVRRGQDGPLCQPLLELEGKRIRQPNTHPPSQNEGRSIPPRR